ncbi:MAG: signal peptidase I [Kiritimatiellae bacterium]|nr:signal peptidase I [Kiritimatiellia bacterium]
MPARETIRRFFFPALTRGLAIRVVTVAVVAFLFFRYVCLPVRIHGQSMAPTYRDGGFNFCWRPRYAFAGPARGDVVVVRLAGRRVTYLKRVVAVAGETVAFRGGRLLVNGKAIEEPYVNGPCDWELPPRAVDAGHVYLIGDNRRTSMHNHAFGQTPVRRILGGPLW